MKKGRFFAGMLSGAMLCMSMGTMPVQQITLTAQAAASDFTADEAIEWVRSLEGQGIDDDGGYGNQCVDLIFAYYRHLVGYRVAGNGADFSWNDLPEGWTRTKGGQPQKGDILVYTNGEYGHVAIYESDYSTWHQNFNYHDYVENVTSIPYNWSGSSYWGCIHPNFSDISLHTNLSVEEGNTSVETVFTWDLLNDAEVYACKIWKDELWNGDATFDSGALTTNTCSVLLPEGHYFAYVDSCAGDKYQMSNTVEFTIKKGCKIACEPGTSTTDTVFTWNEVPTATKYALKIWKDKLWEGDAFYEEGHTDTQAAIVFPEGTYYAYIDTVCGDDYRMSNVVKFTVEKGEPVTEPPTTEPPTTEAPVTEAPTTELPTTEPLTEPSTEEKIPDTPPVTEPPVSDRLYGDTTDDGVVDIMDVITLNKYLLGSGTMTNTGKKNADVNGDTFLDTTDSLNILKLVVEILKPEDFPLQ